MELVNLAGLSLRLKLPAAWLLSQANAGDIPSLRIGRHIRFNPVAVEQALAVMASCESCKEDRAPNQRSRNAEIGAEI